MRLYYRHIVYWLTHWIWKKVNHAGYLLLLSENVEIGLEIKVKCLPGLWVFWQEIILGLPFGSFIHTPNFLKVVVHVIIIDKKSNYATNCSRFETHNLLTPNRTLFPNWTFLRRSKVLRNLSYIVVVYCDCRWPIKLIHANSVCA